MQSTLTAGRAAAHNTITLTLSLTITLTLVTQAEPPPTLLIINPGDMAFEMTPPGKHEVSEYVVGRSVRKQVNG